METENLKREVKPTASSHPLQRRDQYTSHLLMRNDGISADVFDNNVVSKRDNVPVPYAPATVSPITPAENARVHQFFPDQMPLSSMSRMADISQFNSFSNRNIELNSFESSTNELPQQHSYNKIWTNDKNMKVSHDGGLPQSSFGGQIVDSLHMIRQGGEKKEGNFVKPRSRQNPSDFAAFHAPINEEFDGSSNLTFDGFQPKYPEQFGSFLTLGGVGSINEKFETFDLVGRVVTRGSGSAAIVQSNTSFQTADGTFMGSINPSISIMGNSPSIQDDASHIGAPCQDLSGWNFVSNSPRIPSNAGVGFSPPSFLRHTQLGYLHRPSFHSNMKFNHDIPASNNPNFVNLGHHGSHGYRSNLVVQGNNQVDVGQNHAKNLGRHNAQLASLQQNQQTGSGCYRFRELDSEGIQKKNISVTELSRHKTRHGFVQRSNEGVSLWSSSAAPSLIPHSPSLSVLEGRIKHDQSGAGELKMDESSQCFEGASLKRGIIQPPPAAPRSQRRKRVIKSPSQLSNSATAVHPFQPIAESGPYPSPSSLTSTHNPAIPQLPEQPVPTYPSLAHAAFLPLMARAAVPILPHIAQPRLPTRFSPSSLPKNVHNPSPSPLITSTHHILCKDLNETEPVGETCFLCKRDISFTPQGPLVKPTNRPPVAVLPCGHAFHDQCLEQITPPEQCKNPPCIPCAVGESQL